ncbi:MAG: hypothetical protein ACKO6N_20390 [Myxococcota bacterium]
MNQHLKPAKPDETQHAFPLMVGALSLALQGLLSISLTSCAGETYLGDVTPTPMATPIVVGTPEPEVPDWTTCQEGYAGTYYNLPNTHPDVEPETELSVADSPMTLDWWDDDYRAFSRYDASLDFGLGWWPVDTGYEGDPAYFSVRWQAWLRIKNNNTTISFTIAAATDLWIYLGDELLAFPGPQKFDLITLEKTLNAGQYPVEVYFAQRAQPESGLRIAYSGKDIKLCYPSYE